MGIQSNGNAAYAHCFALQLGYQKALVICGTHLSFPTCGMGRGLGVKNWTLHLVQHQVVLHEVQGRCIIASLVTLACVTYCLCHPD